MTVEFICVISTLRYVVSVLRNISCSVNIVYLRVQGRVSMGVTTWLLRFCWRFLFWLLSFYQVSSPLVDEKLT